VVLSVAVTGNQASRIGPVHQSHRTVVAQQQVVGHLANRGSPRIFMTPYGQEELVLSRGQPSSVRLLLAPAFEVP
jgi:hypothetical protein